MPHELPRQQPRNHCGSRAGPCPGCSGSTPTFFRIIWQVGAFLSSFSSEVALWGRWRWLRTNLDSELSSVEDHGLANHPVNSFAAKFVTPLLETLCDQTLSQPDMPCRICSHKNHHHNQRSSPVICNNLT